MATRLQQTWRTAGERLGLEVSCDFEFRLPTGREMIVPVHVAHFGARKGMLVLSSFGHIEGLVDEVLAAGFGFSVMGEPRGGEAYDREAIVEVLADWGWVGEDNDAPDWLAGASRSSPADDNEENPGDASHRD